MRLKCDTVPGMKTKQAIKRAGSAANLAKLLGVSPSAISHWGVTVPQGRIYQLQVLRPDWFSPEKPKAPAQ